MNTLPHTETSPLRWTIAADAAICAAAGLLMLAAASPLADITDLPVGLLRIAGLVIVPYVIFLLILLRRNPIPRGGALAAVGVNLAWAAGCFIVLAAVDMNGLGVAFVIVQAAAVLAFAVLEYRMSAGRSTP